MPRCKRVALPRPYACKGAARMLLSYCTRLCSPHLSNAPAPITTVVVCTPSNDTEEHHPHRRPFYATLGLLPAPRPRARRAARPAALSRADRMPVPRHTSALTTAPANGPAQNTAKCSTIECRW
eukprot:274357-Chlamydomonas_euryale.AAC.5